MDLKQFWLAIPTTNRKAFAKRCGTTEFHMRNVAYGKTASPELALAIEHESGGVVRVGKTNDEFARLLKRCGYRKVA